MKEMLTYLKPYWKGLLAATVAMMLSTSCDLLLPTLMSDILNNGIYRADLSYVGVCCLKMLVVALLGFASVLVGVKISNRIVASYCADLRSLVFRKVNRMTFEEFGQLGTAALVTRATHDVQTVSWIASELCGTIITIPVLFFGGVILAMGKDVMLSLMLLAFVPVILFVVLRVGKRVVPLWEKSDTFIDEQNSIMRERLRGIRVIRAFNAENQEHARLAKAISVMSESFIKGNVAMDVISPVTMFLLNLAAVLIVYFGGWEIERGGSLTGADIFAIVQYVSLVSSGLIMGAFTIVSFPQARVAADRIGQVLKAEGMADPVQRQNLRLSGDIRLEHVSFRYDGAAECALEDVNLQIAPGETVAVIGGTGAGKSTLVSMLLGFRMPTAGYVFLDGKATDKLSRYSIRQNISCALQNTTIYSGTIRENVKMGNLNATDEQILEALETAQAMEFVNGFSDGLDHVIKQSGKNLSGGQKQRLSIARAILKDSPIYVFDDSFSALDFLTEAKLRAALNKKFYGKTRIMITQRVSTAMHADRIYVMDGGRLLDYGTHSQLLARCDVYQEIYASQTGGERVEKE